ncbi:MAG: biotin/lipoate A/B protein ligase family protein [Candidatus Krumholzibacteriia bacterium]
MSGILRVVLDGACEGAVNMQRDAALLRDHAPGDDPVLRIYRWSPPAVTIGYNQDEASFDAAAAAAAGFDFVRRPTGGRAILHAEELTYAVVGTSPGLLFGSSLHDAYMAINRALVAFLAALGLEAEVSTGESLAEARGLVCFKSAGRHEVRVGGRKVIGSAQRRQRGVFLQHGSILTGPRHRDLVRFLPGGAAAPGLVAELAAVTTDLGELLGVDPTEARHDAWAGLLVEAFASTFGLDPR